jgi:hypothetical protein
MTQDIRDDSPESIAGTRTASAFEQVAAWLQANDMSYSENTEQGWFSLRYTCDNADFRMVIDVADEPRGPKLLVYAYVPVRVPEARRPAVAELLARINHSVWLGCLAIDARDGEVSVRTSMPVDDGTFTEAQLEHLFFCTLSIAERRIAGILAVAFGGVAPDLAYEMGEAPAREGLQ